MKLSELKNIIEKYKQSDMDVVIAITPPYTTIGGHPVTHVRNVTYGFDWDQGKFLIWPIEELQPVDNEYAKKFKRLEMEYSRMKIDNMQLRKVIIDLNKKLNENAK